MGATFLPGAFAHVANEGLPIWTNVQGARCRSSTRVRFHKLKCCISTCVVFQKLGRWIPKGSHPLTQCVLTFNKRCWIKYLMIHLFRRSNRNTLGCWRELSTVITNRRRVISWLFSTRATSQRYVFLTASQT